MAAEKAAMRAYVTGADHLMFTQLADGTVQVNVTHSNLKQYVMELRLDLSSPISEVKRKLYTHNGTPLEHMVLQLKDASGAVIAYMTDDDRPLGYYSVENGMEIHVTDTDPFSIAKDGGLDDVSRIAKYRMSDEDYDRRGNTIRAYKKKMLAENPHFKLSLDPAKRAAAAAAGAASGGDGTDATGKGPDAYEADECVAGITLGARCSIAPGDRRGVVAFIGKVAALPAGYWVGIALDEPLARGEWWSASHGGKGEGAGGRLQMRASAGVCPRSLPAHVCVRCASSCHGR